MSLYERVPDIDLSPEFNDGPLFATRPRDYVRLLYDMAYFPQRVRDYVLMYARRLRGEPGPPRAFARAAWLGWMNQSRLQIHLLLMSALLGVGLVLLTVNVAGFLAALLAASWPAFGGMGIAMLLGIAVVLVLLVIGAAGDEVGALATFALPVGCGIGLFALAYAAAPLYGLHESTGALSLLCLLSGAAFGWGSAALFASASIGLNSPRTQAALAAIVGLAVGLAVGFAGWPPQSAARPTAVQILLGDVLALAVVTFAGFLLAALRLDDYAMRFRTPGPSPRLSDWLGIARVTPIALPHLHDHLTAWLDFDWVRGMDNAASLWWYSAQQETVRRALHDVLQGDRPQIPAAGALASPKSAARATTGDDKQADKVLEMISRIADNPHRYPWDMVTYGNPSRSAIIWKQGAREGAPVNASAYVQRRYKRQRIRQRALQRGAAAALPMKTPEQAATAGFWYLERGYIADALDAFKKGPSSPLAREMVSVLEALNTLSSAENLLADGALKLPERPKEPRRKPFWDTLERVQQVVRFARLARQSVSEEQRVHASNEAIRLLRMIAQPGQESHTEVRHVQRLAELWEADLTEWLAMRQAPQPLKPVDNPFIFAEPLRRPQMFTGRERELAELKLAWSNDNLQPVGLHGPPLVGKTSLLHAARNANSHVELAWFHLGHSNRERAGIPQVLAAICAAVQQATVLDVVALDARQADPLPAIERAGDPYAESERFIRHACTLLLPRNLILVLDDFDAVEGLIAGGDAGDGGRITPAYVQFLAFLEHLFQVVKNFSVVLVRQRAPDEAQSAAGTFGASVRLIPVGPLEKKHVAKVLRPAGLPVYFADEAVEAVMRATGGHPYLVQLIAHTAVQRFNRAAADGKGDPLLGAGEVEEVVRDPELQQRAQALFRRLHQVAAASSPMAERVLAQVAQAPYGATAQDLAAALAPAADAEITATLAHMGQSGLIEGDAQGRWRVQTELWRQWEAGASAALPPPAPGGQRSEADAQG